MHIPPLFIEPGTPKMEKVFLTDKVYSQALEAMVVVCADAVIVNKEKKTFILANRISKPMQGWWVIGGRVMRGEDPLEAIKRKFKQETGLNIPTKRFEFVTFIRHQWRNRQQKPQNKPVDDISYTFAIELNKKEIAKLQKSLDAKEYSNKDPIKEFNEKEIQKLNPAIIYLYNLIFKKMH